MGLFSRGNTEVVSPRPDTRSVQARHFNGVPRDVRRTPKFDPDLDVCVHDFGTWKVRDFLYRVHVQQYNGGLPKLCVSRGQTFLRDGQEVFDWRRQMGIPIDVAPIIEDDEIIPDYLDLCKEMGFEPIEDVEKVS